MRLGAPVFVNTDDPLELAKAHKAEGYRAAYCPKVTLKETERIREIETAFVAEGVVVVAEQVVVTAAAVPRAEGRGAARPEQGGQPDHEDEGCRCGGSLHLPLLSLVAATLEPHGAGIPAGQFTPVPPSPQ